MSEEGEEMKTEGVCEICGQRWELHYHPKLLQYKFGPWGVFGLLADHVPEISEQQQRWPHES